MARCKQQGTYGKSGARGTIPGVGGAGGWLVGGRVGGDSRGGTVEQASVVRQV